MHHSPDVTAMSHPAPSSPDMMDPSNSAGGPSQLIPANRGGQTQDFDDLRCGTGNLSYFAWPWTHRGMRSCLPFGGDPLRLGQQIDRGHPFGEPDRRQLAQVLLPLSQYKDAPRRHG